MVQDMFDASPPFCSPRSPRFPACAQREGRAARRFVPAEHPSRPLEGGTRPAVGVTNGEEKTWGSRELHDIYLDKLYIYMYQKHI